MRFIQEKGWYAEEYYNEYTLLSKKITDFAKQRDFYREQYITHKEEETNQDLLALVTRFKYVLAQLESLGVTSEQLILLNLGVEDIVRMEAMSYEQLI